MDEKKTGSRIADSWIRRVGDGTPASASADVTPGSPVAFVPRAAGQGWDPKEIWSQRIDQPRRNRAQNPS
jgi:hypothetical protein